LSKVSCRTFLHVAVEHLAKIYIHEITTNEFQIAFTLLLKLLADKSFDLSIRLELFSLSVAGY